MKFIGHLASSVMAGLLIALCRAVYLFSESEIVAAIVSGIGILAVLAFDLSLFTQKAEKLLSGRRMEKYFSNMISSLLGNLFGAIGGGLLIGCLADVPKISFSLTKTAFMMLLIRSFLGGMLLYVAVYGYRRLSGGLSGSLLAVFAVVALSLCGFRFSVFEACRYAAAFLASIAAIVYLLLMAIGNIAGALLLAWLNTVRKLDAREDHHDEK